MEMEIDGSSEGRSGSSCCSGRKVLLLRGLNAAMALLFFVSAVFQYNDGTIGIVWVITYVVAGCLAVFAEVNMEKMKHWVWRPAVLAFGTGCFAGSIYFLVEAIKGDSGRKSVDSWFDFSGLLLVSIWMSVLIWMDVNDMVGIRFQKIN